MAKSFAVEISKAFKRVEKDLLFASTVALSRTAKDCKEALSKEVQRVFDRPTPWIIDGFYSVPARKGMRKLAAYVGIKNDKTHGTTASEILQPHIEGGSRSVKKAEFHLRGSGILKANEFIVPARGIKLDKYGNVRGPYMVQLLSALSAFRISGYNANITAASINRRRRSGSKKIKKNAKWMTAVFAVVTGSGHHLRPGIYQRYGSKKNPKVKPLFLFVKNPVYRKRFYFFETVEATYNKRFKINLEQAVSQYAK